jgi:hypothetical protein
MRAKELIMARSVWLTDKRRAIKRYQEYLKEIKIDLILEETNIGEVIDHYHIYIKWIIFGKTTLINSSLYKNILTHDDKVTYYKMIKKYYENELDNLIKKYS